MSEAEKQAVLVICLYAAFADGAKHDRERAELQRVAASLSPETGTGFAGLYQDVLLKRRSVEQAVAELRAPEVRQLAYELAVCVCGADGACSRDEDLFLERLRGQLAIEAASAASFAATAGAIAEAPLQEPAAPAPAAGTESPSDAMILNYAILAGALELLPQSLASMAIIPLQMKMVYRIGKARGFELDRGHVKDLLATLGVGLTSQYLEGFGRKLLGGLLGGALGGIGRSIGRAGAGAALSFATTYALGRVAEQYYAGGRRLEPAALKSLFGSLLGRGRELQQQLAPQIEQRARDLDARDLAALVREA
jgi:uncharacterized protein (DUF697 family)/tellurite resistance protein